jgi:hypothetical protein
MELARKLGRGHSAHHRRTGMAKTADDKLRITAARRFRLRRFGLPLSIS